MTVPNNCSLHEAALVAIRGTSRAGQFEPEPAILLEYEGPEECPPEEACARICDLARTYRYRFGSMTRNEEIPDGEYPAEVWRKLVEVVRATSSID